MRIREANKRDASEIAKVQVESWRSTYKGIVSDEFLEHRMTADSRKSRWEELLGNENHFVYVAENDKGEVVGFSSGGPERSSRTDFTGELYAIYILEPYQRKGIGQALVKPVVHHLRKINIDSMLVWVLAENGSRRFYESLGGIEVDQAVMTIGGDDHVEIAYGWNSLDDLLGKLVNG